MGGDPEPQPSKAGLLLSLPLLETTATISGATGEETQEAPSVGELFDITKEEAGVGDFDPTITTRDTAVVDEGAAAAADTSGTYHGTDDDELIPHLLERFSLLYGEGRLEEAVTTSKRALDIMKRRRMIMTRAAMGAVRGEYGGEGPLVGHDIEEYHKAEDRLSLGGGHDTEGYQAGEDRPNSDSGLDEVDDLDSTDTAFAMAGVMNDLGCTLQQVGGSA